MYYHFSYLWLRTKINSNSIVISVTLVLDKNVTATNIHQIYHYIKMSLFKSHKRI